MISVISQTVAITVSVAQPLDPANPPPATVTFVLRMPTGEAIPHPVPLVLSADQTTAFAGIAGSLLTQAQAALAGDLTFDVAAMSQKFV